MKEHAIIPIFIPHRGCPHACVFCDQRAITARDGDITPKQAEEIIEDYLPTLSGRGLSEIEIAFFGGSFTGIPMEEQSAFLTVAKKYKDAGKVSRIRLSTRPDYINEEILRNLKDYSVDTIELGVQSFDEAVLAASGRGHDAASVYRACEQIRAYGFQLGIQLMIGLPRDTRETAVRSARLAAELAPEMARLYPTVILKNTELCRMYQSGSYVPPTHEEMVGTVAEMYRILTEAGVNVIRVGLKSTELISESGDSAVFGNSYHPAFRQLVQGVLARQKIEERIREILGERAGTAGEQSSAARTRILISAGNKGFSAVIGHQGVNRKYFTEHYPELVFEYKRSSILQNEEIVVEAADEEEGIKIASGKSGRQNSERGK